MQQLIVAIIVLGATLYSAWALMPAGLRRAVAARLAKGAGRLGASTERTERLQSALATSGSCSECSSCKGCATPAATAQPPSQRSRVIPIRAGS
jgi:hypothetical protein